LLSAADALLLALSLSELAGMYAIIENSGAQRTVRKDEVLLIDLIDGGEAKPGQKVSFDKVLLVGQGGGKSTIGQPYVAKASVAAEVVEPIVAGEKLYIQKFRTKKAFKKKTGHRQRYTSVKITAINA
jgi:large subunit ribosomal protein L21